MKITNPFLFRSLLTLLVLLTGVCSYGIIAYNSGGVIQGETAPDFTEITLDGNELTLSDYRGNYVLLDFWGSWCGPCVEEIPNMVKAHELFSDRISFIGIPVNDDPDRVRNFVLKNGVNWPQLRVQTSGFRANEIPFDYGIDRYPTLFLIAPDGQIVETTQENPEVLRGIQLIKTLQNYVGS